MADEQGQDVVDVKIEAQADAAEVDAVRELLGSLGLTAAVTAQLGRYASGPAPWAMAIETAGSAFFERLAAEAGLEPGAALERFVASVYELRRRDDRPDGSIRVEDGERSIALTEAVSGEGMRQVATGELPAGSSYFWDDGSWQGI
ncbi:MAG TPA: hypothetical protein VFF79_14595 [Conexibacter sp.]|nr:hypothetical protein [Conexibacter sp.]